MTTITIAAEVFRAVAMFRADRDIRYYFNSVCLETGPQGAFIVASNGHCIAAARVSTAAYPAMSFILRPEIVDQLEKIKYGMLEITPPATPGPFDGKQKRVIKIIAHARSGKTSGATSTATAYADSEEVDGTFPNWRRAARHISIPTDPIEATSLTGAPQYNPRYVELVDDAARIIKGTKRDAVAAMLRPGYDGTCGYAQLDLDGNVGAWVAPMRMKPEDLPAPPTWSIA